MTIYSKINKYIYESNDTVRSIDYKDFIEFRVGRRLIGTIEYIDSENVWYLYHNLFGEWNDVVNINTRSKKEALENFRKDLKKSDYKIDPNDRLL